MVESQAPPPVSSSLTEPDADAADPSDDSYYGIAGLMSRVLHTSGTSTLEDLSDLHHHHTSSSSGSGARPLFPPRPRCVAASNGWIVSVLECTTTGSSANASTRRSLVSRWNVRRGSSVGTDPWLALPGTSEISNVFSDPTASHTLLSAPTGDAYYLHSSSRSILKLWDSTTRSTPSSSTRSGISATTAAKAHQLDSVIQQGLTPHSYITAVAWDKETGTEGSSKPILLGTNLGELYQVTLDATLTSTTTPEPPLLLHKLQAAEGASGDQVAAVTGIHFERLLGAGMVILVATSGRHKRTRLFTFSTVAPHTSFRSVLQHQTSLVELPGSIDVADLRVCNDQFALRTATGIYYGTLDRTAAATGTSGVIVHAGMLPYEETSPGVVDVPVSLALTPHHFITLTERDEVKFVNRVAQKVIQKERVDWISTSSSSHTTMNPLEESQLSVGELLMDVRRPDQIWLRQGRSLVHISSACEDRDVWKFTLQQCLALPCPREPRGHSSSSPSKPPLGVPEFVRQMSATPTIPVLTEEEKAQEARFEHAKSLCSNSTQKAVVTCARAEYHLVHGRTELAAKYMAQCPPTLARFADTSVRLALPMLGVSDPQSYRTTKAKKSLASSNLPLITYLSDRMRVGKMADDSVVCTMIGAWLTELHLHERERSHTTALGLSHSSSGSSPRKASRASEASSQALLHQFLTQNVNNMDAKTIMRILASHDVSASECASYAAASGDIGTAVNAALCVAIDEMAGALDALRILNEAAFEIAEPFYYKHAAVLLARAPVAAAQSFLDKYAQGLSPTKLLPSMMHYEKMRAERKKTEALRSGGVEEQKIPDVEDELNPDMDDLRVEGSRSSGGGVEIRFERPSIPHAQSFIDDDTASISYLEGVIKAGCRSSAIYTYLVSLYASMADEEPLLRFLTAHVPAATTVLKANEKALHSVTDSLHFHDKGLSSPLDMSHALRAILASGRHFRSAIKLYMGFGMRQQAVELALNVDPALARELARESVDGAERKRLWLMIARNAAAGGDNRGRDVVAKVVSVLKDCGPDVLSIEDVLPFLPDFAQIDQIKDEICDALTAYSSKIEGFLKEMKECDQTCEGLREEISRLSSYRMQMKANARCALTNKSVLSSGEPFYVFPSGYVFLASALKKEVMPYLNEKQRSRVEELEQVLHFSKSADSPEDKKGTEALQAELDGLLAAECPLTGSIMVDSIDRGFEGCMEADELLDSMRTEAAAENSSARAY